MKRLSTLALIAALMLACGGLSACGKKGRPADYEGGNYPTQYPNR